MATPDEYSKILKAEYVDAEKYDTLHDTMIRLLKEAKDSVARAEEIIGNFKRQV